MSDPVDVLLRSRQPTLLSLSPEAILRSAMVEIVRGVLRDELTARLDAASAPPRSPWMTPPVAAQASGLPVKTIRAWVRSGRVAKRLKNRSADPKQHKFLVNLDEVVAVAERSQVRTEDRGDLSERARARAMEILSAREAKER